MPTSPSDPFIINQQLGRGVNILGYDPIWKSPSIGRMQAEHFRLIRAAGFNHVRINLHPFRFMGSAPEFTIQPTWLETLDWALEQCRANGLLAILDLHEFTALAANPFGLKLKYLAAWRQLAARYEDAPEEVLFELLNEPNTRLTPEIWNHYLREPLALIRAGHSTRTLIVGPAYWNGIDHLHQLTLPGHDRHIIVTVHYYHPMAFTHQGAAWSPENKDKSGVTWLGTEAEKHVIQRDFVGVQDWALEHQRPILLGEFGVYEKSDMDSRVRYTSFVAREAERLGWSWSYWQFDSDFIAFDIVLDRWVEPIRNALIPAG